MKETSIFLLFLGLFSCNKLCPPPDLRTSRQDNLGSNIRLDGLYYNRDNQFFLYRNGIYRTACGDPNIKSIPDKFKCNIDWEEFLTLSKKDRAQWRLYIVKNDTIYIEQWGLVSDCAYEVFSYNGKILNDTTLLIPINRQGIVLDTFHFVRFSPKPDSINQFIK